MIIRISRRLIRVVLVSVLAVLGLAGLYALGQALTPRDSHGRPVLLSPSVWEAERYRRTAAGWTSRMRDLDEKLDALMRETDLTDPAALYQASSRAQRLVSDAASLVQETSFTAAPAALVGLHEQAQHAAEEYWKAASVCARWVGAPEEATLQEARAALLAARRARAALEQSRWLQY